MTTPEAGVEEPKPDIESFCYLLIHEACKNRPGILVTQSAHAAQECIRQLPVPSTTTFGVLEASSSDQITAVSKKLTEAGIAHCLNVEPDPPWNGAATTLCTTPNKKSVVQPFFVGIPSMQKWNKK